MATGGSGASLGAGSLAGSGGGGGAGSGVESNAIGRGAGSGVVGGAATLWGGSKARASSAADLASGCAAGACSPTLLTNAYVAPAMASQ